jgi:type II secretory pathway pseudopilin PulG
MPKKRGFILIYAYMIIAVLVILAAALLARVMTENKAAVVNKGAIQAFALAEAGIDTALMDLKADFAGTAPAGVYVSPLADLPTGASATQRIGQYRYRIDKSTSPDAAITDANVSRVRSMGYVPNADSPTVTRWLEAYIGVSDYPGHFFDGALWTTGNLTIDGTSYNVNGETSPDTIDNDHDGTIDEAGEGGNVRYGGNITGSTAKIDGTTEQLPVDMDFYKINFDDFKDIAVAQGHYYTAAQLEDTQYMRTHAFPEGFWFNEAAEVANVIYLEGDMTVIGNTHLGGIYVVARDVVADLGDTELGGTVNVQGIIYTLGNVNIHGTVDLTGGVWSGDRGANLKGSLNLNYNYRYVHAFQDLVDGNPSVLLRSWQQPDYSVGRDDLL